MRLLLKKTNTHSSNLKGGQGEYIPKSNMSDHGLVTDLVYFIFHVPVWLAVNEFCIVAEQIMVVKTLLKYGGLSGE